MEYVSTPGDPNGAPEVIGAGDHKWISTTKKTLCADVYLFDHMIKYNKQEYQPTFQHSDTWLDWQARWMKMTWKLGKPPGRNGVKRMNEWKRVILEFRDLCNTPF